MENIGPEGAALMELSAKYRFIISLVMYFIYNYFSFAFAEKQFKINRPVYLYAGFFFVFNYTVLALFYSNKAVEGLWFSAFATLLFLEFHFGYGERKSKSLFGALGFFIFVVNINMITRSIFSIALGISYYAVKQNENLNFIVQMVNLLIGIISMKWFHVFIPKDEFSMLYTSEENIIFMNKVFMVLCGMLLFFTVYLYIPEIHLTLSFVALKIGAAVFFCFWMAVKYGIRLARSQLFAEQVLTLEESIAMHQSRKKMLEEMAAIDSMTSCGSREFCIKRLEELYSGKEIFTMAFVDLDGLKEVNDKYGHNIGDSYILTVVNLLQNICQEGEVYRYGGDEFILLFPGKDEYYAERKMRQALSALDSINKSGKKGYQHSISFGILECDERHRQKFFKSVEDLLNEADSRMYMDKRERKKARA